MPDVDNTAPRTTPIADGLIQIDESRTFQVGGAFTESMLGLFTDGSGTALVRCDLTGKWHRGAEDKPVLILRPKVAREWAASTRWAQS